MAISRLGEVVTRTEDLNTRLTEATSRILALSSTAPTAQEIKELRATLAGIAVDTRTLVRDLDFIDEEQFALTINGEDTLLLWIWRRATRRNLVLFLGKVRRASDLAGELEAVGEDRVVVVRDGDTWQKIAQREMGDWLSWPLLLEANPGITAAGPSSGTTVVIPGRR